MFPLYHRTAVTKKADYKNFCFPRCSRGYFDSGVDILQIDCIFKHFRMQHVIFEGEEQNNQQTLLHKRESTTVETMTTDAMTTDHENNYCNMRIFKGHCISLKYIDLLKN